MLVLERTELSKALNLLVWFLLKMHFSCYCNSLLRSCWAPMTTFFLCLSHDSLAWHSRLELRALNATAEYAVFWHGSHIPVSAEKSKRLSKAVSSKGFQRSRTGNDITPVSSDSYLFTTLHFVMGETHSEIQKEVAKHYHSIPEMHFK